MTRPALTLALVLLCASCGVPQEVSTAEEVSSIAAEGSLLAHDAAEGSTTETFTREHAKALRKLLAPLESAIEQPRLAGIARNVDDGLRELQEQPGDKARAGSVELRLGRASRSAEELG